MENKDFSISLRDSLEKRESEITEFLNKFCEIREKVWWMKIPPIGKYEKRVLLVAHIDTIPELNDNNRRAKKLVWDKETGHVWSPDGLGADDRAGVYAIIKIYNSLDDDSKPYLLFTTGEETGGIGAKEFAYSKTAAKMLSIPRVLFCLEIDRRGNKEVVFYNSEPYDFIKFIESYGFRVENGSYSDIADVGNTLGLCSGNLSAGYYNEHRPEEFLVISHLENTILKVMEIIKNSTLKQKVWELHHDKRHKYCYSCDIWEDEVDTDNVCRICSEEIPVYNIIKRIKDRL